jgi:serine/threonine protein kinase
VEKDGLGLLRMDWMDGGSLERVYQGQPKGKAELELRMKTFGRLCDTVSLVHRSRVVHRDLKPANILLRDAGAAGGQVILIDFGLSFERRTIEGEGTAGYCAPEQVWCRDFGISPQTDIFALAQIAVWLLTGSTAPLLHDEDYRNWDNAGVGSLCSLSPFINAQSEELLLKGLAYSPKNRLRDLQALKTLSLRVLKTC